MAEVKGEPDSLLAIRALENARKFLKLGITTVRDVGSAGTSVLSLAKAIRTNIAWGPRVLSSGPAICMTGGHGWDSISYEIDGPYNARKVAREFLKNQVDLLKVMSTGGMYGLSEEPGHPELDVDEIKAIVEEAHKVGKKVASHASGLRGIINSLEAGVDSIEHGIFADQNCLEKMIEKGTFLVPTMVAFIVYAEGNDILPKSLVEKGQKIVGIHHAMLQKAIKLGVSIATGTDCGGRNKPPEAYFRELEIMQKRA